MTETLGVDIDENVLPELALKEAGVHPLTSGQRFCWSGADSGHFKRAFDGWSVRSHTGNRLHICG